YVAHTSMPQLQHSLIRAVPSRKLLPLVACDGRGSSLAYAAAALVSFFLNKSSVWLLLCLFFFSSRRRHTRFKCDWSSDVCSSDLAFLGDVAPRHQRLRFSRGRNSLCQILKQFLAPGCQRQLRPRLPQLPRQLLADSRRSAGDHHHFVPKERLRPVHPGILRHCRGKPRHAGKSEREKIEGAAAVKRLRPLSIVPLSF